MLITGIVLVLLVIVTTVLLSRWKKFHPVIYFFAVMATIVLAGGIATIHKSGNGHPATRILDDGAVYQVLSIYYNEGQKLAIVKTTGDELLFIEISKYQDSRLDTEKYYVASKENFEGSSYTALKPLPDTGK